MAWASECHVLLDREAEVGSERWTVNELKLFFLDKFSVSISSHKIILVILFVVGF